MVEGPADSQHTPSDDRQEWIVGQAQERSCRRDRPVLPKSETRRVYNAVLKRYWYHAWWFYAHSIVRGGIDKVHIGLEIEAAGQESTRGVFTGGVRVPFGPGRFGRMLRS
jgi:hypothetical protein